MEWQLMPRADKQKMVEDLRAEFAQTRTAFLMAYQGLTVAQVTELRRRVRATASRMKVVKNRLAARAAQDTPLAALAPHFKGPLALAYNQGEPVPLARALLEFARENPQLAFRAGVSEARALDAAGFEVLATLPSREALLARLLGLLRSPQRRLVGALGGPLRNLAAVLRQLEAKKG
jgi:large subunit ribosomal protein L10